MVTLYGAWRRSLRHRGDRARGRGRASFAAAAYVGSGQALRRDRQGRLLARPAGPAEGARSRAAPPTTPRRRPRRARCSRRSRRCGWRAARAPLDVDAEYAALTRAGRPGRDEALRDEVRQLVIASNERRARRGEPPLDVEAGGRQAAARSGSLSAERGHRRRGREDQAGARGARARAAARRDRGVARRGRLREVHAASLGQRARTRSASSSAGARRRTSTRTSASRTWRRCRRCSATSRSRRRSSSASRSPSATRRRARSSGAPGPPRARSPSGRRPRASSGVSSQRSGCAGPLVVGHGALQPHAALVVADLGDRRDLVRAQPDVARDRRQLGALLLDRLRVRPRLLDQRRHDDLDRLVGEVPLAGELERRQPVRARDVAHPLELLAPGLDPAGRPEGAVVVLGERVARQDVVVEEPAVVDDARDQPDVRLERGRQAQLARPRLERVEDDHRPVDRLAEALEAVDQVEREAVRRAGRDADRAARGPRRAARACRPRPLSLV